MTIGAKVLSIALLLASVAQGQQHVRGTNSVRGRVLEIKLHAENAESSSGGEVRPGRGSNGGLFFDFQRPGSSITWSYASPTSGTKVVEIEYALGKDEPRTMGLIVDGISYDVTFTSTESFTNWESVFVWVNMDAGDNMIALQDTGDSGPDLDFIVVHERASAILQAEEALIQTGGAAFTGRGSVGGYFDFMSQTSGAESSLTWNYRSASSEPQTMNIGIHYALGNNKPNRVMDFRVNGIAFTADFAATPAWDSWEALTLSVPINVGINTLQLLDIGDSGPNVDFLSIAPNDGPLLPQWGELTFSEGALQPGATGIPTNTFFALGIVIFRDGQGLDGNTVNSNTIRLQNSNGQDQDTSINTTGGGDSISISPAQTLDDNAGYSIVIDGVLAENGEPYPSLRVSFTTGGASTPTPPDFIFDRSIVANGRLANLLFSEDQNHLYASSLDGAVIRWDVESDGTLTNQRSISVPGRTLIGIAFDPTNTNRIWVSDNESFGVRGAPAFSGKISYIDVTDQTLFEGNVNEYIVGLPRSIRDHLVNSVAFGTDGALYVVVGSNSAMGAPDSAWGLRPESLLSAAVLRIDTSRTGTGPFNVEDSAYDTFASNAVVQLFSTGMRNTYGLLLHSNGFLYGANNGSAAGGNSPDDPDTPNSDESIVRGSTEPDCLYRFIPDGYYGHPNPSRGEWIRNGGNPTVSDNDPFQVSQYPVGTQPEANYQGCAHVFGNNRSPNGIIEYKGSAAFGGALDGVILVTEFSGGDRIVGLQVNGQGAVVDTFIVASGFNNPLTLAAHVPTGNIYVQNYGSSELELLKVA